LMLLFPIIPNDESRNHLSKRCNCINLSYNCRSLWRRCVRRRSWPLGCWDRGFESCWGKDICLLCLYAVLSCVGRGLCDELIPRAKESYQVCNKDSENPKRASENVDRRSNPKTSYNLDQAYITHGLLAACGPLYDFLRPVGIFF
jgi:hypothetical protein